MERIKRTTLSLPLEEGGLGVTQILAKIKAFRVKHITDIFNIPRVQCVPFAIHWLNVSLRKELTQTEHTIEKRVFKHLLSIK
jgi:hypothetical protein